MKQIAAALLLIAAVANAQQNDAQKKTERKTEIVFETGTDVSADIASPNLETVTVGPPIHHSSILKVRENFKDKVMASVSEL